MSDGWNQKTFLMIKPGAVQRGVQFEILNMFQKRGFKLVAMKMMVPSKAHIEEHYAEHKDRPFFAGLVDSVAGQPVVATVWEGPEVIATSRLMIGATNPLQSAPGTIRALFGVTMGKNCIHGSDSEESAKKEIALWFKDDEIASWDRRADKDLYAK
mmetsp:Transcript_15174/g.22725  ORF Transcript_15174/g.22725 Transcript_15174/m.22725 type:complete len:156 (-) Transcript_15174:48-515(-)